MKNMLKCHLSENNYQAFYTKWANVGCPRHRTVKIRRRSGFLGRPVTVECTGGRKALQVGLFLPTCDEYTPGRVGARRRE